MENGTYRRLKLMDNEFKEHSKGSTCFQFTNWANTFSCKPELYFEPCDVKDLVKILATAKAEGKKVRVVGCGHSPSDIACTSDYMVSLKYMNKLLKVDLDSSTVKVEGGITIKDLNESILPKYGLALSVHGSVSDLTLAGAISTGTHGSGINYGNLCTYVVDMELMMSDGSVVYCSREENRELFLAASCGLGAIGIIITLTFQCEPAFNLHEFRFPLSLDEVCNDLDRYVKGSDYFRFLWYPHTNGVLCYDVSKTNKATTTEPRLKRWCSWIWDYLIGYYLLEFLYFIGTFIPFIIPVVNKVFYCILFMHSKERVDISYKVFSFECLFKQYANEWAVPCEKTETVLKKLKMWFDTTPGAYGHYPVEVRFVKGDNIYISPSFGRDSCYINIVMYRPYGKLMPFQKFWDAFENIMQEAGGRPHWAKAHRVGASQFMKMYPYFGKWMDIRKKYDPHDLFLNPYLDRIFSR